MLPISEIQRTFDSIADAIGENGWLFLRPDEADNSFTGAVADSDDLKDLFRGHRYDCSKLVVAAGPKKIDTEWRLVVANSRIIAGSQYKTGNDFVVDSNVPKMFSALHILY